MTTVIIIILITSIVYVIKSWWALRGTPESYLDPRILRNDYWRKKFLENLRLKQELLIRLNHDKS